MNIRYLATFIFAWVFYFSVGAEEVKIGSVVGITGPTATASAEALAMAHGYVARVNGQGGINGNLLKLITRDDQYDAKKTVGLVEEIITQENVVAIVNGTGTAQTLALMKSGILQKYKVPLVGVFRRRCRQSDCGSCAPPLSWVRLWSASH